MKKDAVEEAALELRNAYVTGPIEPVGGRLLEDDAELGYRVQDLNTEIWRSEGRQMVGCKIGLTSAELRMRVGIDEPDFGILFADMQVADRGRFSARQVLHPMAEGELAFCLARTLAEDDLTESAIVDAIEWAAPAIEIVGSRIRDWKLGLVDTIADNGSSGLFMIGSDRRRLARETIDGLTMELLENDRIIASGTAHLCFGSPITALAWLVRKRVKLGQPLEKGSIILSGAFGPPVPIGPARRYRLRMSGFEEPWIDCTS